MSALLLLLVCAWILPCCSSEDPRPPSLAYLRSHPSTRQGEVLSDVLLNQKMQFSFSSELDPSTITRESLRIVDEDGVYAPGRLEIAPRYVTFIPRAGLLPDLSDGGFRLDTRYRVEIAGFPRVDCIRGADGSVLERSVALEFQTVGSDSYPRFDDETLGSEVLYPPGTRELRPGDPFVLACLEPIDPASLRAADFKLTSMSSARAIPFDVRLAANGDAEAGARIEVMPRRTLAAGEYRLLAGISGHLPTDLAGDPCTVRGQGYRFVVREEAPDEMLIEFLVAGLADGRDIPWADGSASWSRTGRVETRFPAAAGQGVDGEVDLGEVQTLAGIEATRMQLAPLSKVAFTGGGGLRVLRAQGRMALAGELLRVAGGDGGRADLADGLDAGLHRSLSQWLASAGANDKPWTVLIAGGDLVITGRLQVDGPLLLVAGGALRLTGSIEALPGQLWYLGHLEQRPTGLELKPATALELDAPWRNPLATPLIYAALSRPLNMGSPVGRWLSARAFAHAGSGGWSVGYLPADAPIELGRLVDHPGDLPDPNSVRILLQLFLEPGAVWDPPFVDAVHLSWAPPD